ncbi:MAG: fluoride efflux transporter CrcB [Demequinaceae bacterium]|nr:fluoride efflux transporter CrcB [Demequinaceae bacterium]
MTGLSFVAACLGCGLGAVLRYWLSTWRRPHHLPWPTLLANVLGTALLGAAAALSDADHLSAAGALIVGGGVAGGLTTFSTLAVDGLVLWRSSRARALAYLLATGVTGVVAGLIGWAVAQSLT